MSPVLEQVSNYMSIVWRSLVPAIFLAPFTLSLLFAVYQLYFHPLAKYPGPLLGRISPFYDLYHSYAGDKHLVLYHLHQKYGTVVRYTPNTVSINDPAALKAIYSHNANVLKGYVMPRSYNDYFSSVFETRLTSVVSSTNASELRRMLSARCSRPRKHIMRESAASPARLSPRQL